MAFIMLACGKGAGTDTRMDRRGKQSATGGGRRSASWQAGVCLVLAFGAGLTAAQDDGYFAVRRASTELVDGVYYLDAAIDLDLSSDAREALLAGVPLTIRFEVEFLRHLRLWWDAEAATLRQRYQVEYHPLTQRYVVRNVNSDVQSSFLTLADALRTIGRVERLPLIDAAVLDPNRQYDVRLRALLDQEELPGPLRLIAFWRRDWSIGSGWFEWRLDDK